MAVKRASMRGKGASIFFGDDEEQAQSDELSNSETVEPEPVSLPQPPAFEQEQPATSRLSESRSRRVAQSESLQLGDKVAKSETARVSESNSAGRGQSDRVSESQTGRVVDNQSLRDRTTARPIASNSATSRLPYSGTFQTGNSPTGEAANSRAEIAAAGRQNLQSSTVGNSRTNRVDNFNAASARHEPQRGIAVADETRADYIVDYGEEQGIRPAARQSSFSEFYSSGETHYLMLEPLATRLTTEQMDRLSNLERRVHQGRRRKEPRVTKNSIIRALLEATFDLDLDTRDISSEMELVNRFREALHLASLVGERQD